MPEYNLGGSQVLEEDINGVYAVVTVEFIMRYYRPVLLLLQISTDYAAFMETESVFSRVGHKTPRRKFLGLFVVILLPKNN
jgi:hypothetical protein